ncbi:polysaccharide deacetylase family protein [Hanstruepera neustonica]|nr:polysaccharide deacetylase family protein [Hanstruepera neustonica]
MSFWWLLPIGLAWLVLTILGSGLIGWNYHLKTLNNNPNANNIAITFDDGPNPDFTPKVLKVLETYRAEATFFCIGKHIESHPDIIKTIIEHGHTIGNHTYSHANNFGFFNTQKVIAELQKTNTIVKNVLGITPCLYRPAFGVTNPKIKRAVKHLHLTTIGWNRRSFDTTNLNENQIFNRITKNLKKGDVILLHDTSEKTIRVLERLLLFLQEKNLQSVTVNDLFNVKAYA